MRKISALFILVIGLMFTANAQSDNAALVVNKADGNIATATFNLFDSSWDGFLTYVETESGNKNFQFTGDLATGPGVEQNINLTFFGRVPPFYDEFLLLKCLVIKSGRVTCTAHN